MQASEYTLVTIDLTAEEYAALCDTTGAKDESELSTALKEGCKKFCRGGYTPDGRLTLPGVA